MTNSNSNNKPHDSEVVRLSMIESGDGKKRSGEELEQLGTRLAGRHDASSVALSPALNTLVQEAKIMQAKDEAMQHDYKDKLQVEKTSAENSVSANEKKITAHQDKIEVLNAFIMEFKDKIAKASQGGNPLAKVYFIIGALINLFLGVYLFVFYSSASYSAFFRPDNDVEMGNAIFYPKAFGDAWNTSILQFLFVLLMPVIFLALGFLLHRFTQKQGVSRYFKVGALYVITFIFDALLAFEISEKMYNPTLEALNYTMSMAFESPNFWIIIFAGFIAYVIWGLVFDFTMDSYAEMKMGATTIKGYEKNIEDIKKQINDEQVAINKCESNNITLKNQISALTAKINNEYVFDTNAIKKDLNSFFQGWISYMKNVGAKTHEIVDARAQLDAVISTLDTDNNNN